MSPALDQLVRNACIKCRGWGHEAFSCPSKTPIRKENEKEKEESAVMVVNAEADFEEIDETTNEGEIDGDYTTCFMAVEVEGNVPPVGEIPPESVIERWITDS